MWFWYALAAALVSGLSVTFNKRVLNRGVHSSVVSFFLFLFCTIGGLILLIKNGWTSGDYIFFFAAAISATVFSVAKTIQLNVMKQSNLSEIYPLNSLLPLIIYILGLITLNETLKTIAIIGLILMVMGVYLINYKSENRDLLHPIKHLLKHKSSLLYMFAMLLSATSSIAQKTALNHTVNNSVFYLVFWENLFLTIIMGTYVLKTNKDWKSEIKNNLVSLVIAGLLFVILSILVLSGIKDGPIALVSAIKKIEILVVLVISTILFNEKPSKYVYIGTVLMLIAVALIRI